jgi:hypothetical protein
LVEQGYVGPVANYTNNVLKLSVCEVTGCEMCKSFKHHLKDHIREDGMIYPPSNYQEFPEGKIVMGDLNTFGWVMVSSGTFLMSPRLQFQFVVTRKTPKNRANRWFKIMKEKSPLFFKTLCQDMTLFQQLFRSNLAKEGSRYMMLELGMQKTKNFFNDYPAIEDMFNTHLKWANEVITKTTSITGQYALYNSNMLLNMGIVQEQHAHTDYPDERTYVVTNDS